MADDIDAGDEQSRDAALITLVELLFFAYRDFTAESDAVLDKDGLGRAHHRVLHFVRRQPGLRVTDLLAILKITKQSLARVLNELVAGGWIEHQIDGQDRRARRLALTKKGDALAERLALQQIRQIRAALDESGSEGNDREGTARRFLFALIAKQERDHVQALIASPPMAPSSRNRS